MNKEWSEQNKRMQSLIKKADTFNEGKDVLFELRNDLMNTAENINIIGAFCGVRDVEELTEEALYRKYNIHQADVMALFGGTILCGGDVMAEAMRENVAKTYIIVGGFGHTTSTLQETMKALFPDVDAYNMQEAELFNIYLNRKFGLSADYLETASTNCGNNITNLLELLEKNNIPCKSIILSQDATMQRRMSAVMRKYRPELQIINYATYRAEVVRKNGDISFSSDIKGMWDMDRYISLIMGEIPRLMDDEKGYGPRGKGYIAHEDIPPDVRKAFDELLEQYEVRKANPEFSS